MKANGGFITREDLTTYKTVERQPIRVDYRGWEIFGPHAARGVRRAYRADAQHPRGLRRRQARLRTAETIHYLAEVLKIARRSRRRQR